MTDRPTDAGTARPRPARRGAIVGCALAVSVLSATVHAATAIPDSVTSTNVENDLLRLHPSPTGIPGHDAPAPSTSATNAVGELSHIVLALAIVIGIIFALRWVAQRFALVPNVGKPGRGVRLLSRTILSPKQQVLLLHVGKRVVVVGDAGAAGMRALCEITDPDEVAALIGDAKSAEVATQGPKSFGNLFRRASEPFAGDEVEPPALAPPGHGEPMSSDVVGLLDKVRGLRQEFDR